MAARIINAVSAGKARELASWTRRSTKTSAELSTKSLLIAVFPFSCISHHLSISFSLVTEVDSIPWLKA